MHLELAQFNALVEGRLDEEERGRLMDHLLTCDMCRTRFQAMNALHREQSQVTKKRIPLRYVLGVAAVMIMAIFPYTHRNAQQPAAIADLATATQLAHLELPQTLGTLAQIEHVNFQAIASDWNGQQGVLQLIEHLHTLP